MIQKSPRGSGCYFTQAILTLNGPFENDPFIKACLSTLHRHEGMQLQFKWETQKETPLQYIGPITEINLERHDWTRHSGSRSKELLEAYLNADRRLGFDASMPLPFRLTLIRIHPEKHVFILSITNAAADEYAITLLLADILSFYTTDRPASPTRCTKFAAYIKGVLSNTNDQTSAQFWRQNLSGYLPLKGQTFRNPSKPKEKENRQGHAMAMATGEVPREIPSQLSAFLTKWSAKSQIPVKFLYIVSWALVLSHHEGRQDIIISVNLPIGSPEKYTAPAVGTNLIPVRVCISQDLALHALLDLIKERLDALSSYTLCSLTDIRHWTQAADEMTFSDIQYSHSHAAETIYSTNFKRLLGPHHLQLKERMPALLHLKTIGTHRLSLMYDRRCYSSQQISGLVDQVLMVLESLCRTQAPVLSEIKLLPQNRTLSAPPIEPVPPATRFQNLIAIQLKTNQKTLALQSAGNSMTCGEFNDFIHQVATHLSQSGLKPGAPVLLMIEDPASLAAAVLGVFHNSGICIPVLQETKNHLDRIIEWVKPEIILFDNTSVPWLPDIKIPKINIDVLAKASGPGTPGGISLPTSDMDSYLLFPVPDGSGMISIPGTLLSSRIQAAAKALELEPDDRILLSSSTQMPEALTVIFSALITGVPVFIERGDAQTTPTIIRHSGISTVCLPYGEIQITQAPAVSRIFSGIKRLVTFSHPIKEAPSFFDNETVSQWIHIFSMYETGGPFGWVKMPDAHAPLSPGPILFTPFPNVQSQVLNHLGQPALPGTSGTMTLTLPSPIQRSALPLDHIKGLLPGNQMVETGLHIAIDSQNRYQIIPEEKKVPTPLHTQSGRFTIALIGNSSAAAQGYKKTDLRGHTFYHAPIFIHFYDDALGTPSRLSVEEIAEKCVLDLTQACPEGPYVIIGECQNAIVAHEAAHKMRKAGFPIALLVIIDENWNSVTHAQQSESKQTSAFLLRQFKEMKNRGIVHMIDKGSHRLKKIMARFIHSLDKARERANNLLGRPAPESVLYRRMETVFYRACEASHYTPPVYDGPVLLLYSDHWIETHSPQLNQFYKGPCETRHFPIMHSEWFQKKMVRKIIEQINAY